MKTDFILLGHPATSIRHTLKLLKDAISDNVAAPLPANKGKLAFTLENGKTVLFQDAKKIFEKDGQLAPDKQYGVVAIDPVMRIARAYSRHLENSKGRIPLDKFIAQEGRRNTMSKALSGIDISSLHFVGLENKPAQSRMLMMDWLGEDYDWDDVQLPIPIDFSAEEIANIRALNQLDVTLYEKALNLFDLRWRAFSERFALKVSPEKRIIVHCGPPKTGSSALQSWLSASAEMLFEAGYLYPTHNLDENSVSSGNYLTLLTQKGKSGPFRFDIKKAQKLVSEFNHSSAHTLVLSSEYFFQFLPKMVSAFPAAEFVFYVRNPIDKIESLYNQSVKRHGRIKPFSLPRWWRFLDLQRFDAITSEYGTSTHYRYYHNDLLAGGSLVTDFQQVLGKEFPLSEEDKRINSSFSFEAMQIMRLANNFASLSLKKELDVWLQRFSQGSASFTLLTESELHVAEQDLENWVDKFVEKRDELSGEKIHYLLQNRKIKPYRSQVVNEEDLKLVLQTMAVEHPKLLRRLLDECKHSDIFADKASLLSVLKLCKKRSGWSIFHRFGWISKR